MHFIIKIFSFALLFTLFMCGCSSQPLQEPLPPVEEQPPMDAPQPAPQPDPLPEPEPAPAPQPEPEPVPEPISIRITAAGDNLLHNTVSFACAKGDGTYDFTPVYENISKIIHGSDIAFINQEVMLTGEASAYPNLAAPAENADALIGAGFNVINLASNHSLDKGMHGLETCLENTYARPFDAVLGAFRTEEEAQQLCIVEKQGIRFGFLSYTYGLNGYQLPADKPWKVSLIEENKMKADLAAIRPACDYLIVSIHWGYEYQTTEHETQTELARLLCDGGADLIIGTHPHVLQPMKWLEREDGHKTLCAYSLGNFVSNQHKRATMLGGILDVKLSFDQDGTLLETTSAGVIPTVTHYKKGYYTIYQLSEYNDELAAAHGIKNYETPFHMNYLNELSAKILGESAISWEGEYD